MSAPADRTDQADRTGPNETLAEAIDGAGIVFRIDPTETAAVPEGFDPNARAWTATFELADRTGTWPYFTGSAILETPEAADVLACLLMDAELGAETFEDFCADTGYDEDSRRAYAAWEECRETWRRLEYLFGEAWERLETADRSEY